MCQDAHYRAHQRNESRGHFSSDEKPQTGCRHLSIVPQKRSRNLHCQRRCSIASLPAMSLRSAVASVCTPARDGTRGATGLRVRWRDDRSRAVGADGTAGEPGAGRVLALRVALLGPAAARAVRADSRAGADGAPCARDSGSAEPLGESAAMPARSLTRTATPRATRAVSDISLARLKVDS